MKTNEEIKLNSDFWNRFKNLCKEKKITQIEICEKTGIDKGKLQGQMTRDIAPTIFDGFKIASALGVSVEYLVSGIDRNIYKNKLQEISASIKEVL